MKKIHLLIIDPQNDFCSESGTLYVEGAHTDMNNLSNFINKYGNKLSGITVTFDIHKYFHIASPSFWLKEDGSNVDPFTIIKKEDLDNGKYRCAYEEYRDLAKYYVNKLEENGRYSLTIWPPHCIAGTNGVCIYEPLEKVIKDYTYKYGNLVNYVFKSINSFTEQYSVLQADVNVSEYVKNNPKYSSLYMDNSRDSEVEIMDVVNNNDIILVSGEALSHCVANSVLDIAKLKNNDLSNFILLEDATSSVKGFENLGNEFIEIAKTYGMKIYNSNNLEFMLNE